MSWNHIIIIYGLLVVIIIVMINPLWCDCH